MPSKFWEFPILNYEMDERLNGVCCSDRRFMETKLNIRSINGLNGFVLCAEPRWDVQSDVQQKHCNRMRNNVNTSVSRPQCSCHSQERKLGAVFHGALALQIAAHVIELNL